MREGPATGVKLQFRQYNVDPEFPVFAFLSDSFPQTPMIDLNTGDRIRFMHFHNCIEMAYCHTGGGELYMEAQSYAYGAGDALLILPYNAHITRDFAEGGRVEYLYFDPHALLRKFYPDGLPCMALFESSAVNPCCVIRGAEHPRITGRVAEILDELRARAQLPRLRKGPGAGADDGAGAHNQRAAARRRARRLDNVHIPGDKVHKRQLCRAHKRQ